MDQEFLTVALEEMDSIYFYAYLGFAFMMAGWLVMKSQSQYKLELLFFSFFLMSGNVNDILTFKIPGISFFEIQPDRFLFLLLCFFVFRQIFFPRKDIQLLHGWSMPWFKIFLYLYAFIVIASQVFHTYDIGFAEVITNSIYVFNILLIMYCVRVMCDEETLRILGTAIVIGAICSSLVSIIQISFDPMFLRVGDQRIAFGTTLRSNGLFINEYTNAYFLITALAWVLVTYKNGLTKNLLFALFSIAVVCAFQRMSWLILSIVVFIYFTQIKKVQLSRLVALGLIFSATAVSIFLLFHSEIMNSSLVRQRLSEPVNSRAGYYHTAISNVGEKPIFGFGGKNNEVYYYNMLRITHDRDRAMGITGDFHSGYFSTMFYYGLLAFLAFVAFIFASIFYFGNLIKFNLLFSIPFLVALLYGFGNLTNTFLFTEYLMVLYAIHMGIGQKLKEMYSTKETETAAGHTFNKYRSWA